jgi:hypothetical protein
MKGISIELKILTVYLFAFSKFFSILLAKRLDANRKVGSNRKIEIKNLNIYLYHCTTN